GAWAAIPPSYTRAYPRRSFRQMLVPHHVHHGEACGARDRVACVGAAQAAWRGGIHPRGTSDDCREWKARGEALRHGDQVGSHTGMLDGEELAGAAETGLDLVGDQKYAVPLSQCAQGAQNIERRRHEAALAEDGL